MERYKRAACITLGITYVEKVFQVGPKNIDNLVVAVMSKELVINRLLKPITLMGLLINSTILNRNEDQKNLYSKINSLMEEMFYFPLYFLSACRDTQSWQWCRIVKKESIVASLKCNSNLNYLSANTSLKNKSNDHNVNSGKKKQTQSKLSISKLKDADSPVVNYVLNSSFPYFNFYSF